MLLFHFSAVWGGMDINVISAIENTIFSCWFCPLIAAHFVCILSIVKHSQNSIIRCRGLFMVDYNFSKDKEDMGIVCLAGGPTGGLSQSAKCLSLRDWSLITGRVGGGGRKWKGGT